MKNVSNPWWMILIKGIILIALAIAIFNHPLETLVGFSVYMGIGLLFTGVLLIITAFTIRKIEPQWGWKLAEGVLDVVFAFILLSNPAITAVVFPFVIGFWVITYGIMKFADSFSQKKEGDSGWGINLLGAIVTIVLGYIVMTDFVAGTVAITTWIGAGLFLLGILNVTIAFQVKKLS
ncbi:uncharacterized membrane protein HdeD (DUF308 family) [Algoriphagus boseongensis]|uniref:Uncharacterized membrane protein HdeD (DUF308 family) n=1 Tax=Algoriphagus boseongensis TaxID=1442587 RepID=A0A4R6TBB0_9BACT|nr:DUF308 domain-containing protein [Algoriphagus boseongensis]TDQ19292.1 uncharacterized membrane protein HdeD (DUF308 family) [Algoriphagus boseongensis]